MIANMQTTLQFTVGTVTVTVNYPTVMQKLDIEKRKLLFSDNMYGELVRSSHNTANRLLNIIDAYSYLSVCAPELKLEMDHFAKLSEDAAVALWKAYFEQFVPWFNKIESELYKVDTKMSEDAAADAKENK